MSNSYVEVVDQALDLLENMVVEDYQSTHLPHFPSSIGAHLRHVIDHFFAILNAKEGVHINYNKRDRYSDVEKQPTSAIESLNEIKQWLLQQTNSSDLNKKVQVTTEIDISHTQSAICESTLQRELVFVSSHAIHHYALIKIIRSMQGKSLPKFFGYAPATITHLTKSA